MSVFISVTWFPKPKLLPAVGSAPRTVPGQWPWTRGKSNRTRMGSKTLRAALVECAHGAARTKGCQFEAHHRALAARRGYKRAIVAGAHKMLRIIYVVLKNGRPYYDHTADYEALMVKRNAPRWIRMLRRYGYVEPVDAELKAA